MSFDTKLQKIMGVLNVTPDSFHDGGSYYSTDSAIAQGLLLAEQGADIIDVGGESTRPGAASISIEEEQARVVPVIRALAQSLSIPISIDTRHHIVAAAALDAGASIVNDVSGLRCAQMRTLVAQTHSQVCLMHMQGQPDTMQVAPHYDDVMVQLCDYFEQQLIACDEAGIARDQIWLDPGFGFGKTLEHNLTLLGQLSAFKKLGCRILVGLSRKAMFGAILNKPTTERLYGSLAATVIALLQDVDVIRTHDVGATKDVLAVVQAVKPYLNLTEYHNQGELI